MAAAIAAVVEETGAGRSMEEILGSLSDSEEMYSIANGISNKLFVAYAPYTA